MPAIAGVRAEGGNGGGHDVESYITGFGSRREVCVPGWEVRGAVRS